MFSLFLVWGACVPVACVRCKRVWELVCEGPRLTSAIFLNSFLPPSFHLIQFSDNTRAVLSYSRVSSCYLPSKNHPWVTMPILLLCGFWGPRLLLSNLLLVQQGLAAEPSPQPSYTTFHEYHGPRY